VAEPTSYGQVLAANVAEARARRRLSQASLARRMVALGFAQWRQQTVGTIERDERGLAAGEALGLAVALETSVAELLCPPEGAMVSLPSGDVLSPSFVAGLVYGMFSPGTVTWQDDEPRFQTAAAEFSAFVRVLAELLRMPGGRGRYEVFERDDGSTAIVIRPRDPDDI
jgi:transcriptional regulator with XRE-family HTH domain